VKFGKFSVIGASGNDNKRGQREFDAGGGARFDRVLTAAYPPGARPMRGPSGNKDQVELTRMLRTVFLSALHCLTAPNNAAQIAIC